MQGRQGILIADDGILVVLQAGLLWSAGGEEKEAKEGGEKSKPFCCTERQIRRFERHEGFLVYRGRMHSGGEFAPVVMSLRKEGSTLASRAKAVESLDFFEDASANQLQKRSGYGGIADSFVVFPLSGLKNCTYFSLHDFSMIMADKNGLLETAKGGIFFRKKKTRIIVNRNFSEWISRPMEEPFLWPPHLPRAVRFLCMCGGSKVQKGGGRNLANGRNYGRVGTRNPRTKRCYAYNILHFRLFCRITALAVCLFPWRAAG